MTAMGRKRSLTGNLNKGPDFRLGALLTAILRLPRSFFCRPILAVENDDGTLQFRSGWIGELMFVFHPPGAPRHCPISTHSGHNHKHRERVTPSHRAYAANQAHCVGGQAREGMGNARGDPLRQRAEPVYFRTKGHAAVGAHVANSNRVGREMVHGGIAQHFNDGGDDHDLCAIDHAEQDRVPVRFDLRSGRCALAKANGLRSQVHSADLSVGTKRTDITVSRNCETKGN